ncbi:MAG: WD40 repeat domain-containing protein [Polyangiales bacterium]
MRRFVLRGAFTFATAATARAARKRWETFYAKATDAPLQALATWEGREARFEGEIAAAAPAAGPSLVGADGALEARWCRAVQALRKVAETAVAGAAEVHVLDWNDVRRVTPGGSVRCAVPDLPAPATRRLGEAAFRHASRLTAMAFSPDGALVATGNAPSEHFTALAARLRTPPGARTRPGGDVRVWEVATGALAQVFSLDVERVDSLWWSPDGAWLAAGTHDALFALDRARGTFEALARDDKRGARHFVVSPDGAWVAWVSPERVWTFDARTRAPIAARDFDAGSNSHVRAERVLALPDGAASVAVTDLEVVTRAGSEVTARAPLPASMVSDAALGPDDRTLWIAGDAALAAVSVPSCELVERGHTAPIASLAFMPDGALASAGWEYAIRLWDPRDGRLLRRVPLAERMPLTLLVALPDGRGWAGAWADQLLLIDLDGASDTVKLPGHPFVLRASPDGRWLALGCYRKLLAVDLRRAELHAVDVPDTVSDVAFADGLAVAACGKEVVSLDLDARRFVSTLALPEVQWLFARDGRVEAWGREGCARIDPRAGVVGSRRPIATQRLVRFRADLTPSGAWARATEHVLGVSDAASGAVHFEAALAAEVTALCFDPSGGALATGLADGSIFLWPVPEVPR